MHQLLTQFADPVYLLCLLAGLFLFRCLRKGKEARRSLHCFLTLAVVILILNLPVVNFLLLRTLEGNFPPLSERPADTEAIVILSGFVPPPPGPGIPPNLGEDTFLRCMRGFELYRQGTPCVIVVSGGRVLADESVPPASWMMRDFLVAHGVDRSQVVVEDQSRTTHENAVETARILRELGIKRVVLVTDAAHLSRALGCFRAAGVDAVPCGCRYRSSLAHLTVRDFLPDLATARSRHYVTHEWLGMAWYKMHKYS
jgi:uncharacterized SAM-binding protein YcdF (DUF218 family)